MRISSFGASLGIALLVLGPAFLVGCYYDARPSVSSPATSGTASGPIEPAMPKASELTEEREQLAEIRVSLESLKAEGKTLNAEQIQKIVDRIDSVTKRLETVEQRLQELESK